MPTTPAPAPCATLIGAVGGDEPLRRLRSLVDRVPSLLAYWDHNRRCQFANQAYAVWFGAQPDELIGQHIEDLLGPQLYALNLPYIQAVLAGQAQTFERAIPGPDGRVRHSLAHYLPDIDNGQVRGFFVQVAEVTALKETEAALRLEIAQRQAAQAELQQREADLREAQRLASLGSWEWDLPSDQVTWSEQMFHLLGFDPSGPVPSTEQRRSQFPPHSLAVRDAVVEQVRQTGAPASIELEFFRTDGGRGWLLVRLEAERDAAGAVVKLRGTMQDITERHRLQLQLTHSHKQLRELAARRETVRNAKSKAIAREVHDDIGAVLTALRMDLTLLKPPQRTDAAWEETVSRMQGLVDQGFQIMRQVAISLRPTVLDLGLVPALEWLASEFSIRWTIPCRIESSMDDLPCSEPTTATILEIVQEALTNIVRHAQASEVTLTLVPCEHHILLNIEDNGRGFDPSDPRHQQGLGLVSMRELAASCGATLSIEPAPIQGTVVRIKIAP